MSRQDMAPILVLAAIWAIIAADCGFTLGKAWERETIQKEAVKAGRAEWVVENDGTTTFKWKEIGE